MVTGCRTVSLLHGCKLAANVEKYPFVFVQILKYGTDQILKTAYRRDKKQEVMLLNTNATHLACLLVWVHMCMR